MAYLRNPKADPKVMNLIQNIQTEHIVSVQKEIDDKKERELQDK